MLAEDNRALIERWFEEVWNKGREEAIDELFASDGVAHGLADDAGEPLRGPENFKPFYRKFREAFPGVRVTVEDTVTEGDKVAARCVVRGRHEGEGLGLAATSRDVNFSGICIVRIRDGQIAEAWNSFDFLSMFRQLGAV